MVIFGNGRYAYNIDYSDGFTGMYLFWNLSICVHCKCVTFACQSYLNAEVLKMHRYSKKSLWITMSVNDSSKNISEVNLYCGKCSRNIKQKYFIKLCMPTESVYVPIQ